MAREVEGVVCSNSIIQQGTLICKKYHNKYHTCHLDVGQAEAKVEWGETGAALVTLVGLIYDTYTCIY